MNAAPQQPESMKIDFRLVAELLPYARNSKNHSPAQVEIIAGSIQRFGWTNPCLIADGVIIAGHGRVMAAKKLGLLRVPCIDLSHLSEADRRAYVIMDNRSAETGASWDLDMLKLETDELRAMGIDLEAATGFSEEDLAKLFEGIEMPEDDGNAVDPDDAPDVPEEPVSVLGDVWVVRDESGRELHRVMCGSALEPRDWDVLMAQDEADLVFTDPPYGVSVGEKNDAMAKAQGRKNKTGSILNDELQDDDLYKFLLPAFNCLRDVMKPGASMYCYHADSQGLAFRMAFRDAGLHLQSILQWRKNTFVLSRWDYHPIAEPAIFGWKKGAKHRWFGGRKQHTFQEIDADVPAEQLPDGRWSIRVGDDVLLVAGDAVLERAPTSVIREPKPARSDSHPTMKPVALVRRHLRNSARQGDLVVDAFGGSGSTGVAAHLEGMRSCMMELSPGYVDVIVWRLEAISGRKAVHAITGEAFPALGEPRGIPPTKALPASSSEEVF